MKYLFLVIMLLTSSAFANEAKVLSEQKITLGGENTPIQLRTVCVDGYKFLITGRAQLYRDVVLPSGVALAAAMQYDTTQMFENQNGVSVPSTCE